MNLLKPRASHSRKAFLATLLGLFGLNLALALGMAFVRSEGPVQNLKLTSSSHSLILFGHNSLGLNVYVYFKTWAEVESYFENKKLELPRIIEVAQLPPALIHVESLGYQEGRSEYKILWSQHGADQNVLHVPDYESAEVFREYVYFQGLESSHLGHSLSVTKIQ
jgi:hypothetical protein